MSHTDHLYTFCFLFQTSDSKPTLWCHCYSRKWQMAIIVCFACCISTLILLNFLIYFWFAHFILSIIFSNLISADFYAIKATKVCLFFVLGKKLFLRFGCFIFFCNGSHCMSLADHLSALFIILLFQIYD